MKLRKNTQEREKEEGGERTRLEMREESLKEEIKMREREERERERVRWIERKD